MRDAERILEEHVRWMMRALQEAEKAQEKNEVPIGAVVVYQNQIIGKGYNQTESLQDPTAHAEMLAISAAANLLQSWRLQNCSVYVTMEPCAMCAGAIVLSRVFQLVFGTFDPKAGSCGSLRNIVQDTRLNHQVSIISGICQDECSGILKAFFKKLRLKEE